MLRLNGGGLLCWIRTRTRAPRSSAELFPKRGAKKEKALACLRVAFAQGLLLFAFQVLQRILAYRAEIFTVKRSGATAPARDS